MGLHAQVLVLVLRTRSRYSTLSTWRGIGNRGPLTGIWSDASGADNVFKYNGILNRALSDSPHFILQCHLYRPPDGAAPMALARPQGTDSPTDVHRPQPTTLIRSNTDRFFHKCEKRHQPLSPHEEVELYRFPRKSLSLIFPFGNPFPRCQPAGRDAICRPRPQAFSGESLAIGRTGWRFSSASDGMLGSFPEIKQRHIQWSRGTNQSPLRSSIRNVALQPFVIHSEKPRVNP